MIDGCPDTLSLILYLSHCRLQLVQPVGSGPQIESGIEKKDFEVEFTQVVIQIGDLTDDSCHQSMFTSDCFFPFKQSFQEIIEIPKDRWVEAEKANSATALAGKWP